MRKIVAMLVFFNIATIFPCTVTTHVGKSTADVAGLGREITSEPCICRSPPVTPLCRAQDSEDTSRCWYTFP